MPTNEELQQEVERLGDVVFVQRVVIGDLEKRLAKAEHDRKRYRDWIIAVKRRLSFPRKGRNTEKL